MAVQDGLVGMIGRTHSPILSWPKRMFCWASLYFIYGARAEERLDAMCVGKGIEIVHDFSMGFLKHWGPKALLFGKRHELVVNFLKGSASHEFFSPVPLSGLLSVTP